MIDRIYFWGDNLIKDDFFEENSAIIVPPKSNYVDLSKNTYEIGDSIVELFDKYDIIYIDLRNITITDIGMGILTRLGCKFYDQYNEELDACGTNLYYINKIKYKNIFSPEKKLRLILSSPRKSCSNALCGLKYTNSMFEGELLARSVHNLKARLDKDGFDINSDLKALDSGGISSLMASVLRDKDVLYLFNEEIDPEILGEEINYRIIGGKDGKSRL